MYYCWSHGLGINQQHTSPMCTFKKDGHIDTATANNMQGGCNRRCWRSPGRHADLTSRGAVGGINDK
jgi:hypothetical protein